MAVVLTVYAKANGVPLPELDHTNLAMKEFARMTLNHYTAEWLVSYPFLDWKILESR